jgi:hypothetical protein
MNPRANAIMERMYLVLGDMVRIQLAKQHVLMSIVDRVVIVKLANLKEELNGTRGQCMYKYVAVIVQRREMCDKN